MQNSIKLCSTHKQSQPVRKYNIGYHSVNNFCNTATVQQIHLKPLQALPLEKKYKLYHKLPSTESERGPITSRQNVDE